MGTSSHFGNRLIRWVVVDVVQLAVWLVLAILVDAGLSQSLSIATVCLLALLLTLHLKFYLLDSAAWLTEEAWGAWLVTLGLTATIAAHAGLAVDAAPDGLRQVKAAVSFAALVVNVAKSARHFQAARDIHRSRAFADEAAYVALDTPLAA